jgi:predicted P-loop ATPase
MNIKKIDFLCTINKNKDRIPTLCMENIVRILNQDETYAGSFRFDTYKQQTLFNDRYIKDSDIQDIMSYISTNYYYFQGVKKTMVDEAILKVSNDNRFDSMNSYLESLKGTWDGVSRIDTWLHYALGTDDDEYHQAVGSNFFKAIIKRNMYPGCKHDTCLVLEGPQGWSKSATFSIIANGYIENSSLYKDEKATENNHVEYSGKIDGKEFYEKMEGCMIMEFCEGETLSKTEVKKIKGEMTVQVDKYRPAYGRYVKVVPRRSVFAMTTNDTNYLKDDTGNRRYLPVTLTKKADKEWLSENRDQLFAEAYHRVMVLGESTYEYPEERTLEEQEKRQAIDPWYDIISQWYFNTLKPEARNEGVTTLAAFTEAIHKNYPSKPIENWDQQRIGKLFRKMGLYSRKVLMGNARIYKYYMSDELKNKIMSPVSIYQYASGDDNN